MAFKMNLWSLTLLPGEKYPMYIRRDFTLTNAALGEELRNENGRSVVKVTHQPLPPHFGDDSDSEFDSDLEITDEEGDEDEFELDEEEGFKLTPKKGKANGDAMEEDDDEEEEDDDEDDEEDEDFSDDEEVEETNVICSLTAGRVEQTQLDLTFVAGDAVMFEVTGENAVHLLGNYIYQPTDDESDSEYDSEFGDEHDDYSDLELDEDESLVDEEEAPLGKITEIAEAIAAAKPKKVEVENKKRKADAIESPAHKAAAAAAASDEAEGLSKSQKKKLAKKAKRDSEGAAPVAAAPVVEKKAEVKKEQSKQKKLPNGLIIEDVTVGSGPAAKTGKRLGMRYVGKLENGKQFDANTGGKPFTFVLGRGEVIKGWDQGLVGMNVGGERRLTIPAPLAYGNQKLPGIPKGSTLKFDVKLLSVG